MLILALHDKSIGVFQLVPNLEVIWENLDICLMGGGGLYLFYICKFSSIDKRKYGVVAEGQGRDWKCDGSSPGHAHFEKVIFKIRLNFV